MSDENGVAAAGTAAGTEAPQASSGDGAAAHQNAPGTEAPQASDAGEPTQVVDVDALHAKMDGIAKKGYGRGREKGKKEALESLANELGVKSISDLKKSWKARAEQQQQQEQEAKVEESKAIRELQGTNKKLLEQYESVNSELAVHRARATAALRAEVKAKLAGMGAIPDAIEDLVSIVASDLDWAADAQSIEVFVDDEGERRPSHESLDEYLGRVQQSKGWFFAAQPASGSGKDQTPDNPVPQHGTPQGQQPSFYQRLEKVQNRRE
jgi:hypothetical protein